MLSEALRYMQESERISATFEESIVATTIFNVRFFGEHALLKKLLHTRPALSFILTQTTSIDLENDDAIRASPSTTCCRRLSDLREDEPRDLLRPERSQMQRLALRLLGRALPLARGVRAP
ncbi:hypothetical protein [Segniliparus rotundus]|uniref:hypothetical protein n=1 Tax=Segniliparus rotundus TaxID=286802 RepID=UPI0011D131D9|nr:hypothetical protein [Segniliparus rotundus]